MAGKDKKKGLRSGKKDSAADKKRPADQDDMDLPLVEFVPATEASQENGIEQQKPATEAEKNTAESTTSKIKKARKHPTQAEK